MTDERVDDQRLMKNIIRKQAWISIRGNIVVGTDMMIGKRTDEVLGPTIDHTCYKKSWDSFCRIIVVNFDMMAGKRTGEVFDPKIDCICYKDKF